jgi:tetratricopeptide (TPR) repeat protein
MDITRALIIVLATFCAGFTTCASFGSGGAFSGDDGEISARGAIGRLEATVSGPLYEGDGGKDIRLAVLAPEAQGAVPEYLPVYVQGLLNNNFKKYGNVTLVDRQNLDRIIAEQNIAANGRFTDADFVKIGGLTNAQYFLIGTIQKLSGDQYSLQLSVSDSSTGEHRAVFMKNGTLRQIEGSGTLINEASADLLAQLGVELTAAGKQSLLAGNTAVVRAESGLAKGITAQTSGASVEALFNYTQAINFDPSQMEAIARLDTLSASISGNSISERIMIDFQARDRWLEAFKEAARFFNEHPPFEISFDPSLVQEGKPDYAKRTVNLGMRVALEPSEAGFASLNTLLGGLEKTGKRNAWGFSGWPLQDLTPKTPGTVVFDGKKSINFKIKVTLLNEKRKVIGKSSVTLSTSISFAASNRAVMSPGGTEDMMHFINIKADDLSPVLTILISAVNGIPSATLNANGYMRIYTFQERAAEFNASGDMYYRSKDYDRAITEYKQAIRLDPSNTRYSENVQAAEKDWAAEYSTIALAHVNKKEYEQALAPYTQAVRLDPSNTAYRDNLAAAQKAALTAYFTGGKAYADKGEYDRAIGEYTQAIRLDPDYEDAYYYRGIAYTNKKDYDRAIADYNQAIRLDPNDKYNYNERGNAYLNKKDYDRAIADYNQAIRLDPSNTAYKNNLQAAQKAKADQIAAQKAEASAANTRGVTYHNQGNYALAIAEYNKAIQLNPNEALYYLNRGHAYSLIKSYDSAIENFNIVLRINPNNADAYNARGVAYSWKNNFNQARADYTKALQIDPNHKEARNNLAIINR